MRRKIFIKNPFRPGSQNYELLEKLKDGPTTNRFIVLRMAIFNSTGRASDVRKKALEPLGLTLESKRIKGNLFEYRIVGV